MPKKEWNFKLENNKINNLSQTTLSLITTDTQKELQKLSVVEFNDICMLPKKHAISFERNLKVKHISFTDNLFQNNSKTMVTYLT